MNPHFPFTQCEEPKKRAFFDYSLGVCRPTFTCDLTQYDPDANSFETIADCLRHCLIDPVSGQPGIVQFGSYNPEPIANQTNPAAVNSKGIIKPKKVQAGSTMESHEMTELATPKQINNLKRLLKAGSRGEPVSNIDSVVQAILSNRRQELVKLPQILFPFQQ